MKNQGRGLPEMPEVVYSAARALIEKAVRVLYEVGDRSARTPALEETVPHVGAQLRAWGARYDDSRQRAQNWHSVAPMHEPDVRARNPRLPGAPMSSTTSAA